MTILVALYSISVLIALAATWMEGAAADNRYDAWRLLGLFLTIVWPIVLIILLVYIALHHRRPRVVDEEDCNIIYFVRPVFRNQVNGHR